MSSIEATHDGKSTASVTQMAETSAPASGDDGATESVEYARLSRLYLWLIIAGFGMMFLAALLMWTRFGPSMFVELVTAVQSCL